MMAGFTKWSRRFIINLTIIWVNLCLEIEDFDKSFLFFDFAIWQLYDQCQSQGNARLAFLTIVYDMASVLLFSVAI